MAAMAVSRRRRRGSYVTGRVQATRHSTSNVEAGPRERWAVIWVAMRQEYEKSEIVEAAPSAASVRAANDPTLDALDALSDALEAMAGEQRKLVERIEQLRRSRQSGLAWHDILSREGDPGSMQMISQMLARLSKASGTLRKELVDSLREEGTSIPAIARLFGVTHQRVSNLLRRNPD